MTSCKDDYIIKLYTKSSACGSLSSLPVIMVPPHNAYTKLTSKTATGNLLQLVIMNKF